MIESRDYPTTHITFSAEPSITVVDSGNPCSPNGSNSGVHTRGIRQSNRTLKIHVDDDVLGSNHGGSMVFSFFGGRTNIGEQVLFSSFLYAIAETPYLIVQTVDSIASAVLGGRSKKYIRSDNIGLFDSPKAGIGNILRRFEVHSIKEKDSNRHSDDADKSVKKFMKKDDALSKKWTQKNFLPLTVGALIWMASAFLIYSAFSSVFSTRVETINPTTAGKDFQAVFEKAPKNTKVPRLGEKDYPSFEKWKKDYYPYLANTLNFDGEARLSFRELWKLMTSEDPQLMEQLRSRLHPVALEEGSIRTPPRSKKNKKKSGASDELNEADEAVKAKFLTKSELESWRQDRLAKKVASAIEDLLVETGKLDRTSQFKKNGKRSDDTVATTSQENSPKETDTKDTDASSLHYRVPRKSSPTTGENEAKDSTAKASKASIGMYHSPVVASLPDHILEKLNEVAEFIEDQESQEETTEKVGTAAETVSNPVVASAKTASLAENTEGTKDSSNLKKENGTDATLITELSALEQLLQLMGPKEQEEVLASLTDLLDLEGENNDVARVKSNAAADATKEAETNDDEDEEIAGEITALELLELQEQLYEEERKLLLQQQQQLALKQEEMERQHRLQQKLQQQFFQKTKTKKKQTR